MSSNEAGFSAEVRKDLFELYGEDIHVNLIPDMMRTGKKPYDAYFLYKGMFCAIEFKRIDGRTFNVDNKVKPHQPECLNEINKAGGTGVFVICFNDNKMAFILGPKQLDTMVNLNGSPSLKIERFYEAIDNPDLKIDRMVRCKISCHTRWCVEEIVERVKRHQSRN